MTRKRAREERKEGRRIENRMEKTNTKHIPSITHKHMHMHTSAEFGKTFLDLTVIILVSPASEKQPWNEGSAGVGESVTRMLDETWYTC